MFRVEVFGVPNVKSVNGAREDHGVVDFQAFAEFFGDGNAACFVEFDEAKIATEEMEELGAGFGRHSFTGRGLDAIDLRARHDGDTAI